MAISYTQQYLEKRTIENAAQIAKAPASVFTSYATTNEVYLFADEVYIQRLALHYANNTQVSTSYGKSTNPAFNCSHYFRIEHSDIVYNNLDLDSFK